MRPGFATALRWSAIVIAVLAAWDPVFTISQSGRPLVAVVSSGSPADSTAATRVMGALRSDAVVVNGAFGGADATVIVGELLPAGVLESASPVFAVTPSGPARSVIDMVSAPTAVTIDAVITVVATIRAAAGQAVDVALIAGGVELERKTVTPSSVDGRAAVTLNAAPSDTGVARLRVRLTTNGLASAEADLVVDVRPRSWTVLAYDAHPSWSARFVRMALERDPRFAVAGRVMTSRAFGSDAGIAPARLDDAQALSRFDVVIVGAPGALTDAALHGLEQYMRTRGGSVVLLLDEAPPTSNAALTRLMGSASWTTRGDVDAFRITAAAWQGRRLRASQISVPTDLPPGASRVAEARTGATIEPRAGAVAVVRRAAPDTRPSVAVWARSVGAGRLVVSGALDAWRYRDSTWSNFDRVWQDLVADAAARAPEPVQVLVPSSVAPGAAIPIHLTLRNAALRGTDLPDVGAGVAADVVLPSGARVPVRLWPGHSIGEFDGLVRAPAESGVYRVEAAAASERGSSPFSVSSTAAASTGPARAALASWVEGNGGRVFRESELGQLADAIRGAISFTPRSEPRHPMRSPWWIVPFALLLSAEWYARRRRGLA